MFVSSGYTIAVTAHVDEGGRRYSFGDKRV